MRRSISTPPLSSSPAGRSSTTPRQKILSADGVDRDVLRGPDMLTADAETSMEMTRNEVLDKEMVGIAALINTINRYGR